MKWWNSHQELVERKANMLLSVEIVGDDLLLMEIKEESTALIVVILSTDTAKRNKSEEIHFQ